MKEISFHEFHHVFVEMIKENFPNTELFIIHGGDYVQDTIMEFREDEKRLSFKPYELYQEACSNQNFEAVIDCFIKKMRECNYTKK